MSEINFNRTAGAAADNTAAAGNEDESALLKTPVACELTVDGEKITYDILRVELKQFIDDHHILKVRIRELGQQGNEAEFSDKFTYSSFLGKSVSLTIKPEGGTVNESRELGFIGIVTRIEMENSIDGLNMAVITAHSPTIALDGAPRNELFHETGASDIVGSIIRNYPVTVGKTDSTSGTLPFVVQYQESDWDFISRMATGSGLFAFYDGKEFRAVKPTASDEEELVWRETLGAFSLGLGTAPMEYRTSVYNYEQKKTFEQDSTSLPDKKSLSDLSKASPDASRKIYDQSGYSLSPQTASDARAVDDALQERRHDALGRMIRCQGQSNVPAVAAGHSVKIKGMNKFDGQYLVTKIVHILDKSGQYQNNFEGVPLDTAHPAFRSSRRHTTFLQSAEVTDNKDPEQMGRVKVKFCWHDNDTPWLRNCTPGAGKDRGQYWIPEIGDEVLVGYEHDSPDLPVVLGAMYNKEDLPPGDAYSDDNYVKVIRTKGGNYIIFNDEDGKEGIQIITKSNSLAISEGSTPTITINTKGGVTFKADQSFKIEAMDMTLETQGDLILKGGANVKIEAAANLDLKGGAMVNLEGMMTNVKGTPIKLN